MSDWTESKDANECHSRDVALVLDNEFLDAAGNVPGRPCDAAIGYLTRWGLCGERDKCRITSDGPYDLNALYWSTGNPNRRFFIHASFDKDKGTYSFHS